MLLLSDSLLLGLLSLLRLLLSCLLGLLLLDDTLLLLELRSQHVLLGLLVVHRGVREVHLSRDVEGIRRFPSSSLQARKK